MGLWVDMFMRVDIWPLGSLVDKVYKVDEVDSWPLGWLWVYTDRTRIYGILKD